MLVLVLSSHRETLQSINEIQIIDDEYDYYLIKKVFEITTFMVNDVRVNWYIYLVTNNSMED